MVLFLERGLPKDQPLYENNTLDKGRGVLYVKKVFTKKEASRYEYCSLR